MNRLIAIAVLCLVPSVSLAQDVSTNEQNKGFLTSWLEKNLSGAGREVRIEGFAGALSSTASLDRLTIADNNGVWIAIEDAVFDWNRSALLRGNLNVNELSAKSIELVRWPETTPATTSPEATEFKLPELPVAIQIEKVSVAKVTLGDAILGEEVAVDLQGNLALATGEGRADIAINRVDKKKDSLGLKGSYSNATKLLDLNLSVKEETNGILVNLLNVPDRPSLELSVSGTGPTSDFLARINLETNSMPRVSGTVQLTTTVDDMDGTTNAFRAELAGDIAPLLAEQYREFVGESSDLELSGAVLPDKGFEIQEFRLKSAALDLGGSLALSGDGLPEAFDISGSITPVSGEDVVLPISGDITRISSATIRASFLAGKSDEWSLDANVLGLKRDAVDIDNAKLSARGLINHIGEGDAKKRHVTATIGTELLGIALADPGVAAAVGSTLSANVALDWQDGAPIRIGFIDLKASDVDVIGSGQMEGFGDNFKVTTDLAATVASLSRFSALAGQSISGTAKLGVQGWLEPLGGAFEARLNGNTTKLEIGSGALLQLVEGDGSIDLSVARDTEGLSIRSLAFQTFGVSAELEGVLKTNASDLRATLSLVNFGNLVSGLDGPANLSGTLGQTGPDWNVDLAGSGPAGSEIALKGSVAPTFDNANLQATGSLPIGLLNSFISAPIDVQGAAVFDLAISGKPSLDAFSGTVSTSDARISAPTLQIAMTKVGATAALSGGKADIGFTGDFVSGGRVNAGGTLLLSAPFSVDLRIDLIDAEFVDAPSYTTRVNGSLALAGPMVGGGSISGNLELNDTEVRLVPTSTGQSIPDIAHVNEPAAVKTTRARAGLIPAESSEDARPPGRPLKLNILINAPSRIFVRGRGLDTELGGSLRITGTSANVIPIGQFDLLRGRLDILGKRLDMSEGRLLVQGSLDPWFRMVATATTTNATVRIITEGTPQSPTVSFESDPDLPDDEILANLLFGRDISSMSPLQAAQLASAVATLAGNGGEGVFGRLRERFNLDDLDVTTDENGAAALRVGKYVTENVYTDVELSSDGRSQINLNLDITPNIVAKGRVASDGETGLGVFFEKDY